MLVAEVLDSRASRAGGDLPGRVDREEHAEGRPGHPPRTMHLLLEVLLQPVADAHQRQPEIHRLEIGNRVYPDGSVSRRFVECPRLAASGRLVRRGVQVYPGMPAAGEPPGRLVAQTPTETASASARILASRRDRCSTGSGTGAVAINCFV